MDMVLHQDGMLQLDWEVARTLHKLGGDRSCSRMESSRVAGARRPGAAAAAASPAAVSRVKCRDERVREGGCLETRAQIT